MAWLDRLRAHLRSPQGGFDQRDVDTHRAGTSRFRLFGSDRPRWKGYAFFLVLLAISMVLGYFGVAYTVHLDVNTPYGDPFLLMALLGTAVSIWGLWRVWAGKPLY